MTHELQKKIDECAEKFGAEWTDFFEENYMKRALVHDFKLAIQEIVEPILRDNQELTAQNEALRLALDAWLSIKKYATWSSTATAMLAMNASMLSEQALQQTKP